jgi:ligand-binding sensor domain-containing protein/signal transduction histidine kinase
MKLKFYFKKNFSGSLLFLFFIVLIISYPVFSQNPKFPLNKKNIRYSFKEIWTKEKNISLSSINVITQTRDGYLWLGTVNGLVRYDGIRFLLFNRNNIIEMKSNLINSILEDKNGTLWIGTAQGLICYKDRKFYTKFAGKIPPDLNIQSLCESKDGTIWIGTNPDGVYRIINDSVLYFDRLPPDVFYHISEDTDGNIWIGANEIGVYKYSNNKLTNIGKEYNISLKRIRSIVTDNEKSIWIATRGDGLYKITNGKLTQFNTSNGFPSNSIFSIYKDRNNNIWFCTLGGGLVHYSDNKFTTYTTSDGLSNDVIKSIYEDREENIWIGTGGGGLNRMKRDLLTALTSKDGLSNNYIWTVYEDPKGCMWIGTNGSGLNRIKENKIKTYSTKDGLSSNNIRSVFVDSDENIWIGTSGGGLNLLKNGKIKVYNKKNGFISDNIKTIYEDSKKNIWIGTEAGLILYKDGNINNYSNQIKCSSGYNIKVIKEDKSGNLWLGTNHGITVLGKDTCYSFCPMDGLSDEDIISLHIDDDNIVWAGTGRGGLNRIKDNTVTKFTVSEGIPDQIIYQILEDSEHNFWMSSNVGVFSVNKNDLNLFAEGKIHKIICNLFGKEDGMLSVECNGGTQPAGCRTKNGQMWFPTMHGVVILDPENLNKNRNSQPPNIIIDNIIVDNAAIYPVNNEFSIPSGEERLEIQFAALSFINPSKNKYKYILEGFDKDWTYAHNEASAYYTKVPPGRYKFRVIACNNSEVWNNTGASISVYIKPYFYQTIWFYVFTPLLLILFFLFNYYYRLHKLKVRENELLALVEKRTTELKELNAKKDKFFSIISHDMKNFFSALMNFSGILKKDANILSKEEIRKFSEYINLSAQSLYSLLCNLLDWAKIQTGKTVLYPNRINLFENIAGNINLLTETAGEKNILIMNKVDAGHNVLADLNAFNSIIRNLLTNSIKFSNPGSIITINSYLQDENIISISVKDNGIGISVENLEKLFKIETKYSTPGTGNEPGTGLGLILVKELIERSGGHIYVTSEINNGSNFTFTLPKI